MGGCLNFDDIAGQAIGMLPFTQRNQDGKPRRPAQQMFRPPRIIPPKPSFFKGPSLSHQQLQHLFYSTRSDNVTTFSQFIQSNPVYNSQACTEGQFWTIGMLCTRWDASNCLRKYCHMVYNEHGEGSYTEMMAVVDRQGIDIVKLAALFRSANCLQVLFQFGGAPLQNRDRIGRSTATVLASLGFTDYANRCHQLQSEGKSTIPMNRQALKLLPLGNLSEDKIDQYIKRQADEDENQTKEISDQADAERQRAQAESKRQQEKERLLKELEMERRLAEMQANAKKLHDEKIEKMKAQSQYPVSEFSGVVQKALIECYKAGTNYKDPQFPPIPASITTNPSADDMIKKAVFRRVEDLFPRGDIVLFDKIDPDDIQQGALGICYYLSTISSMAEFPDRIKRLFRTKMISEVGAYSLQFYIHGRLSQVVIDDYIPVVDGTMNPIFTRPVGKEIWTLLLQKAWVKNFGSYTNAEGMAPEEMLSDLTGAPAEGWWFKDLNEDSLFNLAYSNNQKHFIQILSSTQNDIKGIVKGHAYSLLEVYNLAGVKLYKIRNPWGSFEYEGQYGDNSSAWTAEMKQAVHFENKDDGIFFMTPSEIMTAFNYISVGFDSVGYKRTEFPFTSEPGQQKFIKFTITQEEPVGIQLCQKNARYLRDPNYKYSPCEYELFGNGQMYTGDTQGVIFGSKYTHYCKEVMKALPAGNYHIRLRMLWPVDVREAVIAPYSPEAIKLEECPEEEGIAAWKQAVTGELMKEQGKELGEGICMYTKWYNLYMAQLLANKGEKKMGVNMEFKPEEMINLKTGYNMQGPNVKKQLQAGESFFFTFTKLQMNIATSLGSFGYSLQPL